MCEECGPIDPKIQKAEDDFERAIAIYLERIDQADGILVDWVFVSSQSVMTEHQSSTMIGWSARLDQPAYRTKGLLHEVLDSTKACDIASHTARHLEG